MKYEYQIVDLYKASRQKSRTGKEPYEPLFLEVLNELGEQGWELVIAEDDYRAIFKRQKA